MVHYDFINSLYKYEKTENLNQKVKMLLSNKMGKGVTKICSRCHAVGCFVPKLQQIMAFNQLESSKY